MDGGTNEQTDRRTGCTAYWALIEGPLNYLASYNSTGVLPMTNDN